MPRKKMEMIGVRHYSGGIPDHLRCSVSVSAKYLDLSYNVCLWGISPDVK